MASTTIPAFVHPAQAEFEPRHEWSFGERIDHPECAARVASIQRALEAESLFSLQEPLALHNGALGGLHAPELHCAYDAAAAWDATRSVFPSSFPGPQARADPTNPRHLGAWCFDAGTPLSRSAVVAARWAAASAEAGARALLNGAGLTYALCRPPGHHATRDQFGGYCYYNNAALAALVLGESGRVAVLDVDYHHGNGTQSLFFADPSVLTISLHADPTGAFPYYFGYADEVGVGAGEGMNLNVPLAAGTDGPAYLRALEELALDRLRDFAPDFLVLSMGLDTYRLDPLGDFALTTEDFHRIGATIRSLGVPTVAVQEGGYHVEHLGINAVAMLLGLAGRS